MKIYKWQQKFWAVLASLWCCVSYKHSYWTIYTCLGWLRHCCMCIWCYSFAGLIQDGRYWCGASCWGWWLTLYLPQDAPDDMKPSLRNMGFLKFLCYSSVLVAIFCLLFFTLETFNFFNWLQWIECVGGSTLLTLIFIITIEIVRKKWKTISSKTESMWLEALPSSLSSYI